MQLKHGCRLFYIVLPAMAIDRISKRMALRFLAPDGVREVIPKALSWAFVENTGAAFGMFAGSWLLPLATFALIAVLTLWLLRHPNVPSLLRAGMWLIVGGGLSNLYDRLAYGCVVDFIRLDFVRFAVFNFADIFVCVGAGMAALSVLLTDARRKRADG